MAASFRRKENLLILDEFYMKTFLFSRLSLHKKVWRRSVLFFPVFLRRTKILYLFKVEENIEQKKFCIQTYWEDVFLSVCTQINQTLLRNFLIPHQLHQRKPQRKMQYLFNGKISRLKIQKDFTSLTTKLEGLFLRYRWNSKNLIFINIDLFIS